MLKTLLLIIIIFISTPILAHSGGTDSQGCHAGSQPYHCHNDNTSSSSTNNTYWKSVTNITFTGTKTIIIKSLYSYDIYLIQRWNEGKLTTGDVTVTGGTCVTDGSIEPNTECTLILKSEGSKGKIILDESYTITVNDSGGSSGGTYGLLTLLLLFATALRRKQ